MKGISQIKLSDVFKLVPKPRYVLGTSYSLSLAFFESVVFPCIGRSDLRSCLILCDCLGYQRALTEGPALQGAAQDYLVVPAPLSDCFHPKVWIVVGEAEAVILAGSGNLTQAGFMNNAEIFDALHFNGDTPATPQLLESIRGFVHGLARMWSSADSTHLLCVEVLARIEESLEAIPITADAVESVQFLHSFRGPLIKQMPEIPNADRLYVAAPFFGASLSGLNLLTGRYPKANLSVFPGVQNDATDIPLKQLSTSYKRAKVCRLFIPAKRKDAFAHLKLYGIATKDESAWLFCASANCTEAAWDGANVEAGILRPIPNSNLPEYFTPDDRELPDGSIAYEQNGSSDATLHLSASDSGSRLDIVVAERCAAQLPLRDVTVTVRSGSSLGVCHRDAMFQDSTLIHIDWAAFSEWHRRKKMAVCIEIRGTTVGGAAVRGNCFVENRLLLTADPVHRSAWRGALTLLGEEGAPELADIAAIFSLARDLFDGNLGRAPTPKSAANGDTNEADDSEPVAVAVWPPQEDIRELQRRIGSTAIGQLQWFQRILETLLKADKSEARTAAPENSDNSDEEEADSDIGGRRAEETTRAETVAERVWAKAKKDYEHLHDRLSALVPTDNNAQNIWPAAVFAFLSTMAVFRAVKRLAPGIDLRTDSGTLCDEFLRVMLNERKQHDDFCCPKGFRYRGEKFPALADDLRSEFKVHLHFDLTVVMLALVVDQKLRSPLGRASTFGRRQVRQVCDRDFVPDSEACESCLRVWKRYLLDAERKVTDADFAAVFQDLSAQSVTPVSV